MAAQHNTIALALSPVLLVAGGILWGALWTSAVVAVVPYLYLVAPVPDIAAYALVGIGVHRLISPIAARHGHGVILGTLAMALFYFGNRVIWFRLFLSVWPFLEFGPLWVPVVWEILVIVVGLAAATGLWENQLRHRANP